ncbi:MAG: hypothetical protein A2W93_02085 [Bacteroidetes bacterium GWF2_43_63]|nr:MAG: hypothetical protein A2W94_09990 [Bacteroidetes bacterium GWE2_42_42]OFY55855.1 MAG: hypothetical protein A2W93_02085 [Bacteroidetes bacterium GWF2_43_63]HBG71224.1 hypothetical protein [Bacteroidales bacterium]HCB60555.1 hypothetical protein [Bacteroidales bacterium]HCY22488.1 hypothetical protein [Bacteroidales bacterium]
MRLSLLTILFFVSLVLQAIPQNNNVDRLTITGYYFGKNLVVINPMNGDRFAVESVEVNGNKTSDEINSSVFEIDFSALELNQGDPVSVNISYYIGAENPIVFNPDALEATSNFSFKSSFLEKKTEKMAWTITGSPGTEAFEVEQYRWEKWVRIGTVNAKDSVSQNTYSCKIVPHFGKNLFRVKLVDPKGNIAYSTPVKLQSKTPEVLLVKTTVDTQVDFSGETLYQIYDEKGAKMLSGTSTSVDVTSLPSGKYWVNYDNKTELIKKK